LCPRFNYKKFEELVQKTENTKKPPKEFYPEFILSLAITLKATIKKELRIN